MYFLRPHISTNKLTFIQNEYPKIPLPIGNIAYRIVLTHLIEFNHQSAVRVEIDKVLLVNTTKFMVNNDIKKVFPPLLKLNT